MCLLKIFLPHFEQQILHLLISLSLFLHVKDLFSTRRWWNTQKPASQQFLMELLHIKMKAMLSRAGLPDIISRCPTVLEAVLFLWRAGHRRDQFPFYVLALWFYVLNDRVDLELCMGTTERGVDLGKTLFIFHFTSTQATCSTDVL